MFGKTRELEEIAAVLYGESRVEYSFGEGVARSIPTQQVVR